MVHKSILSAIGVKAQHNQVTTDPLFQSEVILSVEWMSRVAVVDGDYCPVLEKCTTTPLLSVIPGVSSVVRPNTPLHDQEQGEVTAGTHQPHHTPQPGQIAEIWQRRGTLDTASSLVMGTMSPHSPRSVIADWAVRGVG